MPFGTLLESFLQAVVYYVFIYYKVVFSMCKFIDGKNYIAVILNLFWGHRIFQESEVHCLLKLVDLMIRTPDLKYFFSLTHAS